MALSTSDTNKVDSVVQSATQKANSTINTAKEKIDSAQQKINDAQEKVSSAINDVTGAVKDPFGFIIKKTLNKINSLIVNVENKIDQLVKDVVKKTDSKGRVSLEGNTLVITITRGDLAKAEEIKRSVDSKIKSIQTTLNVLRTTISTLTTVQQSITAYKTALDIQEILLAANPISGPIFLVVKKGIKLIFLKEILGEYLKVLGNELAQNKQVLNRLIDRFRSLQVSVKIQDEASKGNYIDPNIAEELLADDLLGEEITQETEDFTDQNLYTYVLKVEKYDSKRLIARAYDKLSGMIMAQTAPSYFSTPKELLEEIKAILNDI